MENKYYTPEIDELHVGFEFEYQEIETAQWIIDKFTLNWIKEESSIEDYLEWSNVRVKFLDCEDMMCDGFILQNEDVNRIYSQFLGMYRGHKVTFNFIYAKLTNWMLITITTNNNNGTTIFAGRVKNKSELRKLMKMLQITK